MERVRGALLVGVALLLSSSAVSQGFTSKLNLGRKLEVTPGFARFTRLAKAAGVLDELDSAGGTVFAPSDVAMNRLSYEALRALETDPVLAKAFVEYHILTVAVYPLQLGNGPRNKDVKSRNGLPLTTEIGHDGPYGALLIGKAVLKNVMMVANGAIHSLDRPLHLRLLREGSAVPLDVALKIESLKLGSFEPAS